MVEDVNMIAVVNNVVVATESMVESTVTESMAESTVTESIAESAVTESTVTESSETPPRFGFGFGFGFSCRVGQRQLQ